VTHGHDHDHGPLEAIDHVHGGPMVLDIGGTVGALHVVVDEAWAGRELFLGNDDPAFSVHTGVWLRHVDGGHVASALYSELEEGTYRILDDDGETLEHAVVRGGEVTEIRLGVAAPGGMGR